LRRIEDKIRSLCQRIVAEQNEGKATSLIVRLRDELHQHVEQLRTRLGRYPTAIERRNVINFDQRWLMPERIFRQVELDSAALAKLKKTEDPERFSGDEALEPDGLNETFE
jgi:hypothetical protein